MKIRRVVESLLQGIGLTFFVIMGMFVIYKGAFEGDLGKIYPIFHWTLYFTGFMIAFPINSLFFYYFF